MPEVVYKLHPSKRHTYFLGVSLLSAMMTLYLLHWPWWLLVLSYLFLAAYGVYQYQQVICLKSRNAVISLKCLKERKWEIETLAGYEQGEMASGAFISRYVSIVSFKCQHKRLSAMIFPDAMSKDQYRHWLIHFAQQPEGGDFHQWPQT